MDKAYRCILSHQVPLDGGFRSFEAGKEYPDTIIPAVSREWSNEGPGDPSPALFEAAVIVSAAKQTQDKKAAAKGQEVKGDDN